MLFFYIKQNVLCIREFFLFRTNKPSNILHTYFLSFFPMTLFYDQAFNICRLFNDLQELKKENVHNQLYNIN